MNHKAGIIGETPKDTILGMIGNPKLHEVRTLVSFFTLMLTDTGQANSINLAACFNLFELALHSTHLTTGKERMLELIHSKWY